MYSWLLFLHIAAVLAFMLVHGVQVSVIWRQRAESDPQKNLALFEALPDVNQLRIAGSAVIATGLALVVSESLWGQGWIWLSLVLLGAIWLAMRAYGGAYYTQIEATATRAIEVDGSPDAAEALEAFARARLSWHPSGLTIIGLGGLTLILWLMTFKPF